MQSYSAHGEDATIGLQGGDEPLCPFRDRRSRAEFEESKRRAMQQRLA